MNNDDAKSTNEILVEFIQTYHLKDEPIPLKSCRFDLIKDVFESAGGIPESEDKFTIMVTSNNHMTFIRV